MIDDFGAEHLRTGDLIVYTSADSVLQIAAHVDEVPPAELYAACAAVREIMRGEHEIGRVIARPFRGAPGAFARTDGRRDLAIDPPGRSYLEELQAAGAPVHAVGKVGGVFNHAGIDAEHPGPTNATAIAATTALMETLDHGLVFTNLVETDQVYGHRKDIEGFHRALQAIDAAVGEWRARLDPARDLLVLTADHGCDPMSPGTDHTREHVPLLAAFAGHGGRRHDGPFADVGASALRWCAGRDAPALPGTAFALASEQRCPSCPRSRRSAATWPPTWRAACWSALEVHDERWCRPLAPDELAAAVEGRRVEALARRGKYLIWELEDDVHLLVHLRMTGTLLLDPPEPPRYRRVRFALRGGRELSSTTRAASAPASSRSAARRATRSSRRGSASSRSARTSPARTSTR